MIKRTLYFGNPAYLSLRNQQLVVSLPETGEKRTIPIEDLGVVMIDHAQVTVTQGVLEALLHNNCAFITCNDRHLPTGMMLPLQSNTTQNERFRAQLDATLPLQKQLWQQTIQCKIYNQAMLLQKETNCPEKNMFNWSEAVKSGDPENLEARAAAYYWKNLFQEIPDFNRERYGEYPNNLLNYGYAILRAIIARSLSGSGLLATLGFHHHNRYNAYCLADDVMEPYRPYVDKVVLELMRAYGVVEELTREIKARLLQIPVLEVKIEGERSPLMVAATQTSASLAKCYLGESRKISYPRFE